jgi:hypothetical protein
MKTYDTITFIEQDYIVETKNGEFTEEDIPKVEYTFSKEEVYKGIKCICHYVVLKVYKKGKKVKCECGFLGFTRL